MGRRGAQAAGALSVAAVLLVKASGRPRPAPFVPEPPRPEPIPDRTVAAPPVPAPVPAAAPEQVPAPVPAPAAVKPEPLWFEKDVPSEPRPGEELVAIPPRSPGAGVAQP